MPLRLGEENIDVSVANVLLVKSFLGTVSLFIILKEYKSVTSGLAVRPVDNDVFLADTEITEEIADLTHISRVRKTTHLEASVAVFGCDKVGKTHVTTSGNSLLLSSIIAISNSILTGRSLITTNRITTTRVGGRSLLLLVTSLVVVASTGITTAIAHTATAISTVVIIVVLLISTISSALATAHASASATSSATTTEARIVIRSAGSALMAITSELFVFKFHLLLHFKVLVFVCCNKEKLDIAIS